MRNEEFHDAELNDYYFRTQPEWQHYRVKTPITKKKVLTSEELKEQYDILDALKKTLDAIKAEIKDREEFEEFEELFKTIK